MKKHRVFFELLLTVPVLVLMTGPCSLTLFPGEDARGWIIGHTGTT